MRTKTETDATCNGFKMAAPEPGEELVISGISGRFPESNNMMHFWENLMNKVDLVTDDDRRWKLDHPEIPQRTGKINNVEKFDAVFFGVHFKQAHTMDPMCRMILEHTYEAIIDAGINPRSLRGTKTGVFIGACFSESEKTWFYEKLQVNGFGITGCSRAMLANRISYWLGINGPSYTVDSACSSSLFAMEHAYRAIKSGQCDAAIVGGANLCLHPYVSLQFSRLGVLSPDGRCKSFDADANGYTRSETVAVVYLQKAKNAKRIYATYVHGKTNCDGFKEQGITFPSSVMQGVLLKEFYDECGLPPSILSYVEAHGTGTKVGDPEELNALEKVFCPDRTTPLRIGSVKSNLGHSEPASGLCSVAKVLIAMESGYIPPNLHYKRPREGVKSLEEGKIQVITEPTPWEGGYVGINSFGFGGANAHILLKSNDKEKKNGGAPEDDLPRLVAISGRTEEAAEALLGDILSRPVDVEHFRLLHDVHLHDIPGHLYRGFVMMPPHGVAKNPIKVIDHYPGSRRPLWFVFSGMGSQWAGMGESLLRLPVFAEAIKKCDAVLRPRKVDIYDILTNKDKKTFDNILNSFVGIAAVQIGLVDILTSLGIVPDRIIGHSVGELGCAYADGCFTAEQMILSAYSRGLASIETKFIHGSMAAVGLGYETLREMCPPDIEIACRNSADSATISGPAESMKTFVSQLQAKGVFAKEVPCSNIPYHSRYIAAAGPKLLSYLQEVIPAPKARSTKWLSTSVPRSQWNTTKARLSSAEYHTNNLLSPVLFEETSALIPKDAATIEIAPHGLLQAILRRSLPESVMNIPMTQRGHKDNVEVLLQGIGKLFNVGFQPDLRKLYPEVQLPVSRGTPMIAPHIKWEHSDDWYVTSYRMQEKIVSGERIVEVTLADEDFEFMAGHVISGRNLLPATGYLALIWETVGMMRGELYTEVSVVFEDVKFLRATNIPKEGDVELTLMVQKGSGRFEVVEGGAAVVSGIVRAATNVAQEMLNPKFMKPIDDEEYHLKTRDIYKEFRLRGYQYSGLFQGLKRATTTGSRGEIVWNNNWIAFMDNMLQMKLLGQDTRGLYVPTGIEKLVIDTKTHLNQIRAFTEEEKCFTVHVYPNLNAVVAGGIEIRGLKANAISKRKLTGEPVLEEYKFLAHEDRAEMSLQHAVRLAAHLALENHLTIKVKCIELLNESDKKDVEDVVSPILLEVLGDLPLMQADITILAPADSFEEGVIPAEIVLAEPKKLPSDTSALIVVGRGLLEDKQQEQRSLLLPALKEAGFVITRESPDLEDIAGRALKFGLNVILQKRTGNELLVLLRKREKSPTRTVVVFVRNEDFSWVSELQKATKEEVEKEVEGISRIILVSQGDFESGLVGFLNCIRKEPGGETVRGVLIQDEKAPKFSLADPFYQKQLQLDLVLNVLHPGRIWGSYRHFKLPPMEPVPVEHAWVNQLVHGDLGSLKWLQGPLENVQDKRLVNIVYSAINFRDVMLATGKLSADVIAKTRMDLECVIGFEFSGMDASGRRVMGMRETRCMTNRCIMDEHITWTIPEDWTMEDAATVPCVYGTALYAMVIKGKMQKGDRVLIHAGSGGVGQAAIHVALFVGCEVFTTVGTPDKRRFIRETFPSIPDDHIGNSRDISFEQMVMRQTKGQGVDIVLNSLAEEKLKASVRCLAKGGRFLEIGKFDMAANNPLGMDAFLKEISFHGVMLDNIFAAPDEVRAELNKIVAEYMKNGCIKPLTRTVFPKDQVEAAFRYMAAGKHIGKVLIRVRDEQESLNAKILALPRFFCKDDHSYVILGGLGGFGLELADWLVMRGARNLVLTSRAGFKNGYQVMRVRIWKSYGVKVEIVTGRDSSIREDCEDILKKAKALGPVDGIFNLAVVLKDNLWENQTPESFEESFRAKAWATKQLDQLSRKMCPGLRQFVVFSSVSCGRGNAGQTNYGMSNSVMERICEKRRIEGFPALAVQWGAVGDVGLVAEMQEDHKELVIGGTLQQRISSCLQELDGFLQQDRPIVASMVVAEKRSGGAGATDIVGTVLNIMGLKDLKTVSQHTPLAELGMDSMMAVEIKQTLEREFEIFLTAQDIRSLNFAKLIEIQMKEKDEEKKRGRKSGSDLDAPTGLRIFVRTVGLENEHREPFMKLNTKCEEGRNEVFLIPGIESCGTIFETLATRLKSPATCLQLTHRNDLKTIEDMAREFIPGVLSTCKDRRSFVIAGYSFGTLIAIELARMLEAEGLNGRLILIDGSPELMKAIISQHLTSTNEGDFQNTVLLGVMDMVAPAFNAQLAVELEKCATMTQRIEAYMNLIPDGVLQFSKEDQMHFLTAIYSRLSAVIEYDCAPLPPIRSPITLIKPVRISAKTLSDDYGLQKVTRDKVEIYTVDGNHITILDDPRVAVAINGDPLEDAATFKASIMEDGKILAPITTDEHHRS
ncbi:fatty acid synthase [Orussus abietinus]|uniref:fatty acid synthase n=1 Tax=Orussus abietinus TaxID=222816 RepID=UPI000625B042|nr:fatty acid synthase [Orussus abietinus]